LASAMMIGTVLAGVHSFEKPSQSVAHMKSHKTEVKHHAENHQRKNIHHKDLTSVETS